jgi:PAS domain S-box-containing protein
VERAEWPAYFETSLRGGIPVAEEDLPLLTALRSGSDDEVQLEIRPMLQEPLRVRARARRIFDAGGRVTGALVVFHEVERSRAARGGGDLRGAIVANMAEGVVLVRRADGAIVYANETFERMFGYGDGEMIGLPVSSVNAPTEKSPEETAIEIGRALRRDGEWHGEIENIRKDGTRFWSSANMSTFDDEQHGQVWVSVHTDVTEHRLAEEALRHAEERFRRVFEEGPIGIVIVGKDRAITDANEAFCNIVGYRPDEVIGTAFADLTHPDDVVLDVELGRQVLAGRIPSYRVDKRLLSKAGATVWISLTATIVRDRAGRPAYGLGIIEEITERKRMEALMVRQNERLSADLEASLRELQLSRARILASADLERRRIERDLHDGAQQRLVALRVRLGLAQELLQGDPARGDEVLGELGNEVEAALEEVRLLAKGVYPSVLADRGLVEALRTAARSSPLPVTLRARGIGRYAEEVETAVYFACVEALQNAAKHAQREAAVLVSLSAEGDLRFSVRDDGVGFLPEAAPAGAGLANMRDRIEAVGGTLAIESTLGEGTTVSGVVRLH